MELKHLEYKKLFKDIKYWKEEYELKKDMFSTIENLFNTEVTNFLNKNPFIKNKWDYFNEQKMKEIENIIEKNVDIDDVNIKKQSKININDATNEFEIDDEKNKEIKKIYRDIVKLTHPDKLINNHIDIDERNIKENLYKNATSYYKNNNLLELLYCANELNIDIDFNLIKIDELKKDINKLKQESISFENTIYWKWYYNNMTETIILQYLQQCDI
jgi:hypothetical protein